MAKEHMAFRDKTLPIEQRVDDLIGRMTLDEKCAQMLDDAPGIERLEIPAFSWWSEGLHGVARAGRATVFPQAISMAASFDDEALQRVATAISDEGRAKYNEVLKRQGKTGRYQGLTFWTPNINIFRDPRWGRGQETYGEDPVLTARLGSAMVRGLQGNDKAYMKIAACAKHFAVHSGPEKLRHVFDAKVDAHDLWDTYLPAFKVLVDEGVEAVMGAYNRTNGEVCCGSKTLLVDILRDQWAFTGHVVSDCWAIRDFHEGHKITKTPEESAQLALSNGCDLNCGCTYGFLGSAIKKGLITEEQIDTSLRRIMRTRFKLGMFDPKGSTPWDSLGASTIGCDKHRKLALEMAEKGIVLLKNKGNVLPFKESTNSIYLTGPNLMGVDAALGNYYGLNERIVTPMEGLVGAAPAYMRFDYRIGCLLDRVAPNPVDWATGEAEVADVVCAFMGLNPSLEGEEGDALASKELGDRNSIGLPGVQANFIKKLVGTGKPVVLVLCGGSPIALDGLEDLVDAIVWLGIPGEEGGTALANIMFGKKSPSGKLPISFPKSLEGLPAYEDYSMKGRTYRYMSEDPLFPFGFGLSYSSFDFAKPKLLSADLQRNDAVKLRVSLKNVGKIEAEEVAQVYLSYKKGPAIAPIQKLIEFKRVKLAPGKETEVAFDIPAKALDYVNDEGKSVAFVGTHVLTVGGCSPGKRGQALGAPTPVVIEFERA